MDVAHPHSSLMVVWSFEAEFRPRNNKDKCLELETLYLSTIGALMYLVDYTRLDIAFVVNLLAIFNAKSKKRHWIDVTHIMRYLKGTKDLGLFYKVGEESNIT